MLLKCADHEYMLDIGIRDEDTKQHQQENLSSRVRIVYIVYCYIGFKNALINKINGVS
jgi:hypothetical protein